MRALMDSGEARANRRGVSREHRDRGSLVVRKVEVATSDNQAVQGVVRCPFEVRLEESASPAEVLEI